jgi:hypothetical protein
MAIRLYLVPQKTTKRLYALSDIPLGTAAKEVDLSTEDLLEYMRAKSEYMKWQRKLAHLNRYGWMGW